MTTWLPVLWMCLAGLMHPVAANGLPLWSCSMWAGREPIRLEDYSDRMEGNLEGDRADWLAEFGGRTVGVRTVVSRGWSGGWEMDRRLGRFTAIGVRIGVVIPHDLQSTFSAWGAADETQAWVERMSATLVPVLVGFTGSRALPIGFRIRSGVWAGPVFVSVSDHVDFWFNDPNTGDEEAWSSAATAAGTGVGVEAEVEVGWESASGVEAFVGLGWRSAKVTTLHWTHEADRDGNGDPDLAKGDVVVDEDGTHLGINATGMLVRVGIRLALH